MAPQRQPWLRACRLPNLTQQLPLDWCGRHSVGERRLTLKQKPRLPAHWGGNQTQQRQPSFRPHQLTPKPQPMLRARWLTLWLTLWLPPTPGARWFAPKQKPGLRARCSWKRTLQPRIQSSHPNWHPPKQ